MLSSVSNDNSAISSQFSTRTRNLSSPITPQSYQSPAVYTTTITTPTNTNMDPFATSKSSISSEMKLKIIVGNDIIAVKFNNKIQKLQELRELVRKRLDVGEQEHVRLYYSRDDSHQFAPLLNDKDLQSAISQEKVLVMAEIHA
ncbi:hypothetical protein WICPIJ_002787 [Wickerhamomyces pijperi]|uniref:PB1 domain-containing protein n=1 Tax=Wickerhamomyces pijperi TaxID=599730 RepID=A0A9P8QB20_WICPI|nr:hypothetical protein WICPIJ_002787 [Wickerhamomyces pijperi]